MNPILHFNRPYRLVVFMFFFCPLFLTGKSFSYAKIITGNANNGGTIAANQDICLGETPLLLQNVVSASGGDVSLPLEYFWMQTNANSSFPSGSWAPAFGINDQPTYQPPVLSSTTFYIRCARRQGFTNYAAESNIVTINVLPSPTVMIVNPPTSAEGFWTAVNFSAAYSPISTYAWDFNEDGIPDCFSQHCTTTFQTLGIITVSLTVTNSFGCSLTTSVQVEVVAPLPVELISFEAILQDDEKVLLKWATASEQDNSYFQIQRSLNGTHFEDIGWVAGVGNSSSVNTYSFEDPSPRVGENYYRLKQVDIDGDFEYFEVKRVILEKEGALVWAYPSPAFDEINIRVLSSEKDISSIELYSVLGQSINFLQEMNSSSGIQTLDISGLDEGIYLVKIRFSDKKVQTVKFVKN